ncbi:hypothetical protein LCGC14_1206460, partial [marine sediment metagenome]
MFEALVPPVTVPSEPSQREVAYFVAEQQMVKALSTPLVPTQISGSFSFVIPYQMLTLPHKYIRSVDAITARGLVGTCNCDMTNINACAVIRSYFGYVDTRIIAGLYGSSGCGCGSTKPYDYNITYTAGLTTGTAMNDKSLHRSLAILARLELLDMLDPGGLEGGGGDPGVQSYSSLGYSETRVDLDDTPFGKSALANKAWNLVDHLYIMRPLKMG